MRETSHTYVCECSSFADINFIGRNPRKLWPSRKQQMEKASIITSFQPSHVSISLLTTWKMIPLLILLTSKTPSPEDDQNEACVVYVDRLNDVSDFYGRKEMQNGCLLQKTHLFPSFEHLITSQLISLFVYFSLCFHLLSTLWNVVNLGLQLQETCAAHPLACPVLLSQSYRLMSQQERKLELSNVLELMFRSTLDIPAL